MRKLKKSPYYLDQFSHSFIRMKNPKIKIKGAFPMGRQPE